MKFLNEYLDTYQYVESIKGSYIAIYGAGRSAQEILKRLKEDGYKIACFIDKDKNKQNKQYLDIPVVSKKGFEKNYKDVKLIISSPRGLGPKSLGLEDIKKVPVISFDKYYVLKNTNSYNNLYKNIFQDKLSKKTLKNLVLCIVEDETKYYEKICTHNQYFCLKGFMQFENDHYVDVGSFTGEDIERFILLNPNFKKIVAFEPTKRQFKALGIRIQRLISEWALSSSQIELVNSAVGGKSKKIALLEADSRANFYLENSRNFSNTNKTGNETIDITTIDEYFKNNGDVGLLKADIEGHELSLLRGAKKTIKKQLPKIAICVYHNINDLLKIIKYLDKISKNQYNYSIRHHSNSFSETVLYCLPKHTKD